MPLKSIHLISAYVLWCLGTYSLWLGEWEDVPPYPILVVILAFLAFFLSDHGPRFHLSPLISNCLGIVILAKMLYDLVDNPQEALTALAHFLCYLQTAKWFRVKIPRDFMLLYLMSILQVAIGAILAKQSSFGIIITIYFLLSIWCGILFFLACQQPVRGKDELPDQLSSAHYFSVGRRAISIWGGAMLLSLAIFWLLPRTAREIDLAVAGRNQQQWTGFTSVVSLENDSRVLENGDIAFTIVSVTDASGDPVELPLDILWRGNVFSTYRNKEWKRTRVDGTLLRLPCRPPSVIGTGQWSIEIEKVADTGNVLLSPAGIISAEVPRSSNSVKVIRNEERIIVDDDVRRARLRYTVVVDPSTWTAGIVDEDLPENYLEAVQTPPLGLPRVQELARSLTSDLPADNVRTRIDRVYKYLTESGEYEYSLSSLPTDPTIEPIEDFLFSRKKGHCEFFASSLAVLLRHAGVASRLVTGFKGVDQNRAGGYYQVRQLYAHAWVEAYLPDQHRWITLDPTPGEARTIGIEKQRSWWNLITDVRDVFTRIWGYYIVNFSVEDQQRVLLAIRTNLIRWIGVPMTRGQELLTRAWQQNALFVIIALVMAALATAGLMYLAYRLIRGLWQRWNQAHSPTETRRPEYQQWLDLLERHQLLPGPSHTPHDIARIAQTSLVTNPQTLRWETLPWAFAETWCRARFGHEDLTDDTWRELDQARQELESHWQDPNNVHTAQPGAASHDP
jgi:transglutaminase-like putative cysteine protease